MAFSHLALQTQDLGARKGDFCVNWVDSGGTPKTRNRAGTVVRAGFMRS